MLLLQQILGSSSHLHERCYVGRHNADKAGLHTEIRTRLLLHFFCNKSLIFCILMSGCIVYNIRMAIRVFIV